MFLIVLSPAKSLDFDRKLNCKKKSIPDFIHESKTLIKAECRIYDPQLTPNKKNNKDCR